VVRRTRRTGTCRARARVAAWGATRACQGAGTRATPRRGRCASVSGWLHAKLIARRAAPGGQAEPRQAGRLSHARAPGTGRTVVVGGGGASRAGAPDGPAAPWSHLGWGKREEHRGMERREEHWFGCE
jgi:hypothetical protein